MLSREWTPTVALILGLQLTFDVSTEPVKCLYLHLRAAFGCRWRQSYDHRKESQAQQTLRFYIKKRCTNVNTRKPVVLRHIVLALFHSSHGHLFRPRDDREANTRVFGKVVAKRSPEKSCGDCAMTCNLRATFVRICPDQSLSNSYTNRTIIVYNVNPYVVAK